jgi:actin-like ATPase involved in cell morphogenesis
MVNEIHAGILLDAPTARVVSDAGVGIRPVGVISVAGVPELVRTFEIAL